MAYFNLVKSSLALRTGLSYLLQVSLGLPHLLFFLEVSCILQSRFQRFANRPVIQVHIFDVELFRGLYTGEYIVILGHLKLTDWIT
jgi:hypothetical protein